MKCFKISIGDRGGINVKPIKLSANVGIERLSEFLSYVDNHRVVFAKSAKQAKAIVRAYSNLDLWCKNEMRVFTLAGLELDTINENVTIINQLANTKNLLYKDFRVELFTKFFNRAIDKYNEARGA